MWAAFNLTHVYRQSLHSSTKRRLFPSATPDIKYKTDSRGLTKDVTGLSENSK